MTQLNLSYLELDSLDFPGLLVCNGKVTATSGRLPRVGSRVSGGNIQLSSKRFGLIHLIVHIERLSPTDLRFELDLYNLERRLIHQISFRRSLDMQST